MKKHRLSFLMTKAVLFGIRVPFPQNLDASSLPSFQCCQSPSQQGSGVRLIPLSCVCCCQLGSYRQTFWVGMALPTEPSQPVLGIWVIRRKGESVLLERGKWIFLNQSVTTGWFYFSRIRARRNIAVTERVKP